MLEERRIGNNQKAKNSTCANPCIPNDKHIANVTTEIIMKERSRKVIPFLKSIFKITSLYLSNKFSSVATSAMLRASATPRKKNSN